MGSELIRYIENFKANRKIDESFRDPTYKNLEIVREKIVSNHGLDPRRTWFVQLTGGLGDAFLALGLMDAFRCYHRIEKLVGLLREGLVPVLKLYPGVFDVAIKLNTELVAKDIRYLNHFGPGKFMGTTKISRNWGNWVSTATIYNIPHVDWVKHVLRLPMTTPFKTPDVFRSENLKSSGGENPVALLLPLTSYTERLEGKSWSDIVKILREKGYKVVVNAVNRTATSSYNARFTEARDLKVPDAIFAGCELYDGSLEQLFNSIINYNVIIGPGGGLVSILQHSGLKTVVLYYPEVLINSNYDPNYRGVPTNITESSISLYNGSKIQNVYELEMSGYWQDVLREIL